VAALHPGRSCGTSLVAACPGGWKEGALSSRGTSRREPDRTDRTARSRGESGSFVGETPPAQGIPSKLTRSARGSASRVDSSQRERATSVERGERLEDWGADSFLAALGQDAGGDPWPIENSPDGAASSPLPSGRVLRRGARASDAATNATTPELPHVAPSAPQQQIAGHPAPPSSSDSAVERASALLYLSLAHLQILQTTLLGAYHQAVIAFDAAGARAMAEQIVGGLRQMEQAQARVEEWVPQAGAHGEPSTAAAVSSAATAAGPPSAEMDELARLRAAFAEAVHLAVASLAVQLSPQLLGWEPVAGPLEPPTRAKVIHVGAELVGREAARVVELLEAADHIAALAMPQQDNASHAAQPDDLRSAVDELERFRSRPIDSAFLAKVLQRRGVWPELEHARSHGTGRTAANLLRVTQAQAAETGATAEVGSKWNASQAEDALSYDVNDWAVSDGDAMAVVEMLGAASPEARGGLVRQLHRKGLLERMTSNVGWQYVKQLAESLNDPEAEALLAPLWEDKGGVPSLGQLLQKQAARNHAEGSWLDEAQALGWETLDLSLDVFTFGGKPAIDGAREAVEAGWISEDAYAVEACTAEVRAALVGAATMATGGAAGAWSEGAGLALGAGEGGSAVLGAALGGAAGNVGGQLAGDTFDQAFSGKQGFDSFSSYAQTFASGGLVGAAMAPVGLAAARYLPAGMRTMAQQLAARHPEMVHVLEAARAAGMGTAFRVRMTVREWLAVTGGGGGGGPFSSGGLQPAFAMAGEAPDLSALPPDTELWITARPKVELNALSERFDDDLEPAFELDSIEAVDRHFGDYGREASYADDAANGIDLMGEGPEVEAVRIVEAQAAGMDRIYRRPNFRPGVREAVYEQARADSSDGIVRNPGSEEEIPYDSNWQMGHRRGWEFRKHRASAARRHLTREQFVDEYNDPTHYRPETPETNQGHSEEAPAHIDHWYEREEL
jgi:HNH/ENDO VII superfamily nuclease with conserved GHE residues